MKSFSDAMRYGMYMVIIGVMSPFVLWLFIPWHNSEIIAGTILVSGMVIMIVEMYRNR